MERMLNDSDGAGEDEQAQLKLLTEFASDAEHIERQALILDRAGEGELAVTAYRQAVERLTKAVGACPEGLPEKAKLSRHAGELLGRCVYLESLNGLPTADPLEDHISSLRLRLGSSGRVVELGPAAAEEEVVDNATPATDACEEKAVEAEPSEAGSSTSAKPSRTKRAVSAAAVGGAVGLAVLHAPLVAVGLAAGAAYATTRQDGTGEAARKVGDAGLEVATCTKSFVREHQLPERAERAIGSVRAVDAKYGISERAQSAATSSWDTLREINSKYKVSKKLSKGVSSAASSASAATSTVSSWVARASSEGSKQ